MPHTQPTLFLILAAGLVMAPSTGAWAQWSEATSPSQVAHEHAKEAYDNEQFALALHLFEQQMPQLKAPLRTLMSKPAITPP